MGDLRSLSGPLCAVLGRSWGLCWRSGGGLGTLVGACVGDLGAHVRDLGASVGGPGLSWAEKWPKPEREADPHWAGGNRLNRPNRPNRGMDPNALRPSLIFSIDMYLYIRLERSRHYLLDNLQDTMSRLLRFLDSCVPGFQCVWIPLLLFLRPWISVPVFFFLLLLLWW